MNAMHKRYTPAVVLALAIFVFGLLSFPGCGGVKVEQPETLRQYVAAGHAAYGIAANTLADAYTNQPECTSPVTVLPCSKSSVVLAIRDADKKAYAALLAADHAITTQDWSGGTADHLLASAKALLEVLIAFEVSTAVIQTANDVGRANLQKSHDDATHKLTEIKLQPASA